MASDSGPASLAASTRRSWRRARSATRAPRRPRPTAMERPSPLEAPTITVLITAFPRWGPTDPSLLALSAGEQAPGNHDLLNLVGPFPDDHERSVAEVPLHREVSGIAS